MVLLILKALLSSTFAYDTWGRITSITGTHANGVGLRNPFRYRGYVYDDETGLYYLNSRYYNPEMGRFVSADGYISAGSGILSKNMFSYCLNNPVIYYDPTGEIAVTTLILIGSIVVGVAVAGYTAYDSYRYTGQVDWANTIVSGVSAFMLVYSYGMSAYGMYINFCNYKGYAPVTNVGNSSQNAPQPNSAPYGHLKDPDNVAPGKNFSASQKA